MNCPRCSATIVVPNQDETPDAGQPVASAGIYFPAIAGAQDTVSSSSVDLAQDSRTMIDLSAQNERYLLVSRRVLYLQALLIAVVAAVAFGAGYLIGESEQRESGGISSQAE